LNFEDFKSRLSELQISIKDFSEMTNMSYRTIFNYRENQQIPGWVSSYIDLLQKNKSCNSTIIANSIFYRIKKKQEAELINQFQDVIVILHRSLSPLSNNTNLTFKQIEEVINKYNLRLLKDVFLDLLTNKSKIKAINFLQELEEEEQDFITHNLSTFLNILWECRIYNNLGVCTFDTKPTT